VTGPEPEPALSALRRIAAGDEAVIAGPAAAAAFTNDLEAPVVRRHGDVRMVRERLAAAGVPAFMSGSGPTVVGVLPSGREPRLDLDVERDLEEIAGRPVRYARTLAG
jgi:4-diphosphocytidyl-2C-methyl-D-erythritol kinase